MESIKVNGAGLIDLVIKGKIYIVLDGFICERTLGIKRGRGLSGRDAISDEQIRSSD